MTKTLVFNFDGTKNEPGDVKDFAKDKSISNVYKLHLLLGGGTLDVTTPDGGEQHSFYYKGIGTYGNKLRKWINETVALRDGDVKHILDAAANDFQAYEEGDRVVVFGFSRGAALAREFVSDILKGDDSREVSFLGVFDTVVEEDGTKKRKAKFLGEDGTLDKSVKRAVHIVALDEDRRTFRPTLINKDDSHSEDEDRILEVWFPGVHTDSGGSHWHDGLSDQALAFMIEQVRKEMGGSIHITQGDDRESVEALLKGLKESDPAQYQDIQADDIVIYPLVTGTLHVNWGLLTKLEDEGKGAESRRVCVKDNDQCSPDDSPDYPLVHHSVKERFDLDPEYRPAALRGVTFKLYQDDGSHSEPIHGINGLRETAKIVPLE